MGSCLLTANHTASPISIRNIGPANLDSIGAVESSASTAPSVMELKDYHATSSQASHQTEPLSIQYRLYTFNYGGL